MMKTILTFSLLISMMISSNLCSQVGINTVTPDASSALDIFSKDRGVLMPRLTTIERDNIALPATGLMIFNITMNDGQLNSGTPSAPIWTGMKEQDGAMIATVMDGAIVSTTSTTNLLVPGMSYNSPASGNYLVTFNAQIANGQTYNSAQGINDMNAIYDTLKALVGTASHNVIFGNGEILLPGIYDIVGAMSVVGTLTLDGQGDPNSLFVMRSSGTLTTGSFANVVLVGNAEARNIFWLSDAAMSTGANSIFKGSLVSDEGAISLGADASVLGRFLARVGALSMNGNGILRIPSGDSVIDLKNLASFAMFTGTGAVSDCRDCTTVGDVASGTGAVTMTGTHVGQQFPAGQTTIPSISTYSFYQNGVEILNSIRKTSTQSSEVNIQSMLSVTGGQNIEVRWKVDQGASKVSQRILSLIRSRY